MLLHELLKSAYEYTPVKWNGGLREYVSEFVVDSGDTIKVVLMKTSVHTKDYETEAWSILFKRLEKKPSLGGGAYKKQYAVNGKGDAYKIFATVNEIIPKLLKAAKEPEWVLFTAEEDSRKKLYNTLVKKFGLPNYKRVNKGAEGEEGEIFDGLEMETMNGEENFLFRHKTNRNPDPWDEK